MEDDLARLEAAAIVLAGGLATRMGEDKALVEINGEPLLHRALRLLSPIFEDIFVAANKDLPMRMPRVTLTKDRVAHQGPLGGIHAGLLASGRDWNFVMACDMPFVSRAVIECLWDLRNDADVVVPEAPNGPEPLHAFYRKTCIPAIEAALGAGKRRVISFFPKVRVVTAEFERLSLLDPVAPLFLNVNSPADIEVVRRMMDSAREDAAHEEGRQGRPEVKRESG